MGKKNSFLGIKSSGRNPLVANGLILIGLALISHIGILALDGYSTAYAANGTFLPDQVNDVTDGTSFGCGFPPIALGSIFQSFTPSVSTLAAVDVRLRAGGDFPMLGYDTTIKIRAGTYDGQEVGTATTFVSGPQIGGTELLVRFLFSPSICLIPGDTYVIEWISPEGGGVILTWMGATSNSYENGSFFGCQGLPPTGEEWDLYFITYTLASDVILDQHQSVIDNTLGGLAIGGSSEQILAQVVTAAVTGFLTEVRFPVVCTGGDLTVQIQGVKEGEDSQNLGLYIPNGVILASETISGTSLPTFSPNPPSFRNLPFSRPPTISAGDRFAIVLSSNANDGCAVFQGPDGNPYSEGEAFFDARPNTPGVWLPITIGSNKHDLPFQTIIGIPIDDDTDCDGIPDDVDNCLDDPNADQLDTDRDKIGDVCDDDDDNDTILDANDNCPLVFNFDQANKDGDNYGDACDNCPDIINNDQTDSDGDGLGNACEEFAEDLDVPPASTTFRPGAPLWVTATFTNSTTQSIQTIRPDCFNTTFTVTNPAGIILDPRYRIRQAYGIPTDLVFIPGQFSVTCNLAEMFDQRILNSGPGGNPVSYDLVATYSNDHLDPDIVNGVCTDPTNECYNLIWTGEVSSDRQSVTIAGSPVTTATANVVFAPNVWVAQWAFFNSPPISAQISNIDGHSITEIDTSTILLNGTVPIIDESVSINNGVLTVQFDRSLAVQSLGTAVPGIYYPAVQGGFNNGSTDIFYGEGRVEIVEAIYVEIDIKPGSFPNSINLGSNGKVPVAIFSTPEFDAKTIDPGSVTLAGAGVAVKGKGDRLMASFEDKNDDGRMDLVVHVNTQAFEISESDELAVLEGETYGNIPIIGSDSIRIVPPK